MSDYQVVCVVPRPWPGNGPEWKLLVKEMNPSDPLLDLSLQCHPHASPLELCGWKDISPHREHRREEIESWRRQHPHRYILLRGKAPSSRDDPPTTDEMISWVKDASAWTILDRHDRRVWKYRVENWHPDGEAWLPHTRRNLRRVKRAISIALEREGRQWALKSSFEAKNGYIWIQTPFARVDRIAHRILLHDWQRGKLEGMPLMRYPACVYERYYVSNGSLYFEAGYLYPDGSFVRMDYAEECPEKESKLIV